MYTLYYSPGACSMAIHAVLNELGVPFKIENVATPDRGRTPEYLKLNPRGTVPALMDDGYLIREGGAIVVYLLDKHKSPMLPREGLARAKALEWLMFCNATLHPAYGKGFFCMKNADKDTQAKLMPAVIQQIEKLWQDVDQHLASSPYLAGKECTAADILMSVIANWSGYFPQPIKLGANARRVIKEVSARPAFRKTVESEGVDYKAAA